METSHPAGGAWIEMLDMEGMQVMKLGRTPQGVRGLKFKGSGVPLILSGRTPQGVRGLKYGQWYDIWIEARSHPAGGAWIEIETSGVINNRFKSHPAGGAWIEMKALPLRAKKPWSHPAGGAWIEIAQDARARRC